MNKNKSKLHLPALITFIVGMVACVAGVVVLIVSLVSRPAAPDAEFLVEMGAWMRTDAPSVIWDFTDIGHGKLTTNSYANVYDFIWVISGRELTLQTDWLYDLNDTFEYRLDQSAKILTLKSGEIEYTFQPSADGLRNDDDPSATN